MKIADRDLVGWALAGASALCGVLAAYYGGGKVAALSAASGAFATLAGAWGYTGSTPKQ